MAEITAAMVMKLRDETGIVRTRDVDIATSRQHAAVRPGDDRESPLRRADDRHRQEHGNGDAGSRTSKHGAGSPLGRARDLSTTAALCKCQRSD